MILKIVKMRNRDYSMPDTLIECVDLKEAIAKASQLAMTYPGEPISLIEVTETVLARWNDK